MDVQILNFLNILKRAVNGGALELTEPDWEEIYKYGRLHGILPLLYEGLEGEELPEEAEIRFMTAAFGIVSSQAARTDAFLEVYDKLLENGIEPLVLKGLICRSTYGELGDHRPSGDEDIWIKTEDFYRCKEILEENGFVQEKIDVPDSELCNFQEITFENSAVKVCIEVHLNLTGNETKSRAHINRYFDGAMNERIETTVNGHKVYTLSHTKHFVYLFLHFYKHITLSGAGIRPVIDIMMYRRAHASEIDFDEVERAVAAFSGQKLFADITHIANEYLGFDFEASIPPSYPHELLKDIIEGGTFGNADKERFDSNLLILADEGTKGTIGMALNALFPPIRKLKQGYPILLRLPWLLPFVWVYRIIGFLWENKKQGRGLGTGSIAIAKRRLKMLRDYGLEE